ncbi:hypothetical protein BDW71DRAFT_181556 [Aspergillus fruticulosus]
MIRIPKGCGERHATRTTVLRLTILPQSTQRFLSIHSSTLLCLRYREDFHRRRLYFSGASTPWNTISDERSPLTMTWISRLHVCATVPLIRLQQRRGSCPGRRESNPPQTLRSPPSHSFHFVAVALSRLSSSPSDNAKISHERAASQYILCRIEAPGYTINLNHYIQNNKPYNIRSQS